MQEVSSPVPSGKSAVRRALGAQLLALLLVGLLRWLRPEWHMPEFAWAMVLGGLAGLLAFAWHMPRWWWLISVVFAPLAVLAQSLQWPSWVWLAGFIVLLLIFWRTDTSQVPLYMTNSQTALELAKLLPPEPCRLIDLGCGDGRLLRQLASLRPDCQFVGYEHAPLTWLWAWFAARNWKQVDIRWGNFWEHDLGSYNFVYAFLSPVPMQRLWQKFATEMPVNARLISNSFPVSGITASAEVRVNDSRRSHLWIYTNRKV